MYSTQTGLISANFSNETAANQALGRLRRFGIQLNEIALEKGKRALTNEWLEAMYMRVPEGILMGLIAAPLPSLGIAFILEGGMPSPLAAAFITLAGTILGVCLGVFWGVVYSGWETVARANERFQETVSVAVRCVDPADKMQARRLLEETGAESVKDRY